MPLSPGNTFMAIAAASWVEMTAGFTIYMALRGMPPLYSFQSAESESSWAGASTLSGVLSAGATSLPCIDSAGALICAMSISP